MARNGSPAGRRLIKKRVHQAITHAANDHFFEWRLSGSELWTRIRFKVKLCLRDWQIQDLPYALSVKNLILGLTDSRFTNFYKPLNAIPQENKNKKQRLPEPDHDESEHIVAPDTESNKNELNENPEQKMDSEASSKDSTETENRDPDSKPKHDENDHIVAPDTDSNKNNKKENLEQKMDHENIFKDNTEPEHKDTDTENEDLDAKLAELPTEPQTKK